MVNALEWTMVGTVTFTNNCPSHSCLSKPWESHCVSETIPVGGTYLAQLVHLEAWHLCHWACGWNKSKKPLPGLWQVFVLRHRRFVFGWVWNYYGIRIYLKREHPEDLVSEYTSRVMYILVNTLDIFCTVTFFFFFKFRKVQAEHIWRVFPKGEVTM